MTRDPTELDRGAVAAIRLLLRSMEVTEDETEWSELAEGLVDGIEREGLPAMVRLGIDFERDFIEECAEIYGPFPRDLAVLARGVPKTVWRGDPRPPTRPNPSRRQK